MTIIAVEVPPNPMITMYLQFFFFTTNVNKFDPPFQRPYAIASRSSTILIAEGLDLYTYKGPLDRPINLADLPVIFSIKLKL